MRRCLEEIDVEGIRELWREVAPEMPQPSSDHEALAAIHLTRTQAEWLRLTQRFYSHRWLLDHNLISGLPDHLRPSAERIYPKTVSAVGLSINSRSEWLKPALPLIRGAMEAAIHEAYADGRQDDIAYIKARMAKAKAMMMRKLLGRIKHGLL
jgi:hypothetical protein